jgi:hypothetical protein
MERTYSTVFIYLFDLYIIKFSSVPIPGTRKVIDLMRSNVFEPGDVIIT